MSDLESLFQEVRDSDGELVLRCTDPDGTHRDIQAVPLEGPGGPQWVQTWDNHDRSHTLSAEAVRNRMKASDPDVRIVPERKSLFADLKAE